MEFVKPRWKKFFTQDGYEYFFNSETNDTQWEKPDSYVEDEEPEAVQEEEEEEHFDGDAHVEDEGEEVAEPPVVRSPLSLELYENNLFSSEVVDFHESVENDTQKLNFLQTALQSKGSDSEWIEVIREDNFFLIRYLLSSTELSVPVSLQNLAVQCLAFIGVIWPNLWVNFCSDGDSIPRLLSISEAACRNIIFFAEQIKAKGSKLIDEPYAGFDMRDIKDFNLEGITFRTEEIEGVDFEECIMHWLLLITQVFSLPLVVLSIAIRTLRVEMLGFSHQESADTGTAAADTAATDASAPASNRSPISSLCRLAQTLIRVAFSISEDTYLQSVKAISAINNQFPSIDIIGSTEVANVCAGTHDVTALHSNHDVGISEGLLHVINDVGYPGHVCADTLPVLKLCIDLVESPSHEGFFYTNDVKILVDVILRELSNIPCNPDATDSEQVQLMYVQLLSSLVHRSAWNTVGEQYRKGELISLLENFHQDRVGSQLFSCSDDLLTDLEEYS